MSPYLDMKSPVRSVGVTTLEIHNKYEKCFVLVIVFTVRVC